MRFGSYFGFPVLYVLSGILVPVNVHVCAYKTSFLPASATEA